LFVFKDKEIAWENVQKALVEKQIRKRIFVKKINIQRSVHFVLVHHILSLLCCGFNILNVSRRTQQNFQNKNTEFYFWLDYRIVNI
jgi:hypothetical protein